MAQDRASDTDQGIEPVDENDTVAVPRVLLETLYDLAIGSMDFGSEFWVEEDQVAVARVAVLLGIEADPNEVAACAERRGVSVSAATNWTSRLSRGSLSGAYHPTEG